MAQGRKRTPTVLRIVKGNPQKRALPTAEPVATPIRPDSIPPAPALMSLYGVSAWNRLAPLLSNMGVLTDADLIALERLCEAYAEVQTARDTISDLGGPTYSTVTERGDRMFRTRPEAAALADADRRLKGWLAEFGLTPAARSKVQATGKKDADPLAAYFGE